MLRLSFVILLAVGGCAKKGSVETAEPAAPPEPAAAPSADTAVGASEGPPALVPGEMATGVDIPGSDYKDMDLPEAKPELCRDKCAAEAPSCVAWTYVNPGVQGANARCWLKSSVPAAVRSDCCTSGVR